MSQPVIKRVDIQSLAQKRDEARKASSKPAGREFSPMMVRWYVMPLTIVLSIILSCLTLIGSNTVSLTLTSTLMVVTVVSVIFGLAVIVNPMLRLLYIGKWAGDELVSRLQSLQGWAGKLTLGLLFAMAVVHGPGVMIWLCALVLGIMAGFLIVDLIRSFGSSTGSKSLGVLGKGAISWLITFSLSLAIMFVMAKTVDSMMLVLGLIALVTAVYSVLWCLGTRSITRAELMTILAALVVTSGISTFGLTEQLVPLITTPYNPEWNTPQAKWSEEIHPNLRNELYITDPVAIREYREGTVRDAAGVRLMAPSEVETGLSAWKDWLQYYVNVAKNLPWKLWIVPLAYWLVFVLGCYAMFYSLTYTVVEFWADREKLIFPLAQLRESLLPDNNASNILPAICRSTGFWMALLFTAGLFSYNASARFGWLGDMSQISQAMNIYSYAATFKGTFLEGISGGAAGMRFAVLFTAVGIAFLLPLEISFSIWFYYLASRVLMLVLVHAGYGRTMVDFPTDWLYVQNEVSAQGAGAIMVFSVYMLYRALKDNSIQIFSKARPVKARWLSALPVIGLTASITMVTMWVWWMWHWNMSYLFWAVVFVIFLVLLTLGLMRITAEGGIYWFQSHASFFHFWKMLALGKFLPGTILAPLLPVYSVLFLDIKTFMAPNLIDGAKIQRDVGGSRLMYHLNMVVTILVAVCFSVGFAIVMAYARGAQRMHSWFYSSGPKNTMTTAQQAASSVPEFNTYTASWAFGGGIWVIISIIARRTMFWFPHPIGYIMLINPMIHTLWTSFLIGWICKKLVVTYGGKNTFDKTRNIFIGLIIGELLAICGWGIATFFTGLTDGFMNLNNTY